MTPPPSWYSPLLPSSSLLKLRREGPDRRTSPDTLTITRPSGQKPEVFLSSRPATGVAPHTLNRHTAMHPATATTPFTLLWASIARNEEDPPQRSLAPAPRALAQQTSRAPMPTAAPKGSSSQSITRATAQPTDARARSVSTPARNERAADAFIPADFLVTNLRPDLLD